MAADLCMPLLAFACCRVYRRLESLSIDDDEGEVSMHACIHAWGIHKSVLQGQLPCMNMHFHTFHIIIPFPFNPLWPDAHTHHLFCCYVFQSPCMPSSHQQLWPEPDQFEPCKCEAEYHEPDYYVAYA